MGCCIGRPLHCSELRVRRVSHHQQAHIHLYTYRQRQRHRKRQRQKQRQRHRQGCVASDDPFTAQSSGCGGSLITSRHKVTLTRTDNDKEKDTEKDREKDKDKDKDKDKEIDKKKPNAKTKIRECPH